MEFQVRGARIDLVDEIPEMLSDASLTNSARVTDPLWRSESQEVNSVYKGCRGHMVIRYANSFLGAPLILRA